MSSNSPAELVLAKEQVSERPVAVNGISYHQIIEHSPSNRSYDFVGKVNRDAQSRITEADPYQERNGQYQPGEFGECALKVQYDGDNIKSLNYYDTTYQRQADGTFLKTGFDDNGKPLPPETIDKVTLDQKSGAVIESKNNSEKISTLAGDTIENDGSINFNAVGLMVSR